MKNLLFIFAFVASHSVYAQSKATMKLFSAIEKNNTSLAQNAIKDGADVNGVDRIEAPTNTVLIRAVQLKRLEIVKLLLASQADVNIRRPIDRHTALMVAASDDQAQIAKILIESGADINLETLLNRTALHIAALKNSLSVAKILVQSKDIDVNIRPSLCAMAVASRQGHVGIVLLLKTQIGSKASSPVCLERSIELAQYNKHEDVLAILQRN